MTFTLNPFHNSPYGGAQVQNATVVPLDGLGKMHNGTALPALTGSNLSGAWLNVLGINGAIKYEIAKTGTGTCNFKVQDTLDRYDIASASSLVNPTRYGVLGSGGTITVVVGDTSMAAGTVTNWIVVYDPSVSLQILLDTVSGSVSVTTRAYLVPQ